MRSRSTAALAQSRVQWEGHLATAHEEAIGYSREIFAVADLLEESSALSRALTDPARSGDERVELAKDVFGGKIVDPVAGLVASLVRQPLSDDGDLVIALRDLGVSTLLASAEHKGRLREVGDELYRIGEFFRAERGLRRELEDRHNDLSKRQDVISNLFGSMSPETVELVRHAVERTGSATLINQLRGWTNDVATRVEELTAIVTVASPLEDDQVARLTDILSKKYGRPVEVHVGIDPSVVGGMKIQVGSDVIDGTLSTRLKHVNSAIRG